MSCSANSEKQGTKQALYKGEKGETMSMFKFDQYQGAKQAAADLARAGSLFYLPLAAVSKGLHAAGFRKAGYTLSMVNNTFHYGMMMYATLKKDGIPSENGYHRLTRMGALFGVGAIYATLAIDAGLGLATDQGPAPGMEQSQYLQDEALETPQDADLEERVGLGMFSALALGGVNTAVPTVTRSLLGRAKKRLSQPWRKK